MKKITDQQIIHCLNLYLDLKYNKQLLFNNLSTDELISYIQKNW